MTGETETNIVITSDSTCDLGEKLISERGIGIQPLTVILGSDSYKDGIDIVPEDIFRYFEKTGELPKTAAPSVSDYENFFRGICRRGENSHPFQHIFEGVRFERIRAGRAEKIRR